MPSPIAHGTLTPLQHAVLTACFRVPGADAFALYGGTGLTEYYSGHRLSQDIGLFTLIPELVRPFARALEAQVPVLVPGTAVQTTVTSGMFSSFAVTRSGGENIKLEVGVADPPSLGLDEEVEGIRVASLRDIAAGKAHALCDRDDPKDAIDLWAVDKLLGVSMGAVRDDLFAKDAGLAEAPLAWYEAFRRQADREVTVPPELERMMLIEADPQQIKSFLSSTAETIRIELLAQARTQSAPGLLD
ncbi:MAG: nucleotidyl transferase AbiEii/AbiGii toxin family protein [Candidatus Dormibacteria bacterium]